ncbi:hypothetical protein C8R44DRAFT_987576 [Mycena epipterygia]|nr:hypothetical protein C8R44DRAFT_987576 [Mycena epipterygia]
MVVAETKGFPAVQGSTHPSDEDITPSYGAYALEAGKTVVETVESLSSLIPVPFLSGLLKLAITVLKACEEATAIGEKVEVLQERACKLTLVIIRDSNPDSNPDAELQSRINDLHSKIIADLNKIKDQKKIKLFFFPNSNKDRADKCLGRLNAALERFHVSHELRTESLLNDFRSRMTSQLNRIENIVTKISQPHNAPLAPRFKDIPPPHRIFCGRELLIQNIASLLAAERTSRVCITGVGGMGKTSVALAVVQTATITTAFPKSHIFWIPCVEATSVDQLRHLLYTQLRITAESYDSLDPLIAELDASKQRRLLLLDNFETPWLSTARDQDEVGDILVRLAALPHIALMITMTSGAIPEEIEWQHRPLEALDPSAARDAFKAKYRDAARGHELAADGPELNELLASIGYIPLAITLMAAAGGRLWISPEDLLGEWEKVGTKMISGGASQSMDHTIGLSMRRGVMESSLEAMSLLAILSLLPAGTTGNNLRRWAPSVASHAAAVDTLRTAALIQQGDGPFTASRIFVPPTIQSYMSHQNRISAQVHAQVCEACYEFVIAHKSIPDDAQFKANMAALASEESNIHGFLTQIDAHHPPKALDALIAFILYQIRTKPSIALASHSLRVAIIAYSEPRVAALDSAALNAAAGHVGEAHRCLGKIFFLFDRYAEATEHFETARLCFKNLPGGADRIRVGECSMELVDTWNYDMRGRSNYQLYRLASEAKADLSHNAEDRYHVARGSLGLQGWSSNRDEAFRLLDTTKATFEDLGCSASASECLFLMARMHAYDKEYSAALPLVQEALKEAEKSGDILLLSFILRLLGVCFTALGSYAESFGPIERRLSLSQVLGSPLGIANSLELLGYTCAGNKDLSGARAAYEGALEQFAKVRITIARTNLSTCTYHLLVARLAKPGLPDDRLFVGRRKQNGGGHRPFTRKIFIDCLKACLTSLGIASAGNSGYGFRRGAAT